MTTIRILIIEDNPITAMDLQEILESAGYIVIGKEKTAEEAIVTILSEKPEVLIVDIKLAGKLDGIEMVNIIREVHRCPVIYLTANSDTNTVERALQTSPSAFITKPFQSRDVTIAIEIAFNNFLKEVINQKHETASNFVFLKSGNTFNKVDIREIMHVEAQGSYCQLYTKTKAYTLSVNLNHFIQEADQSMFIRIHRSHAVNIEHIDKIDHDYIYVNSLALPIGPSYRSSLKTLLKKIS